MRWLDDGIETIVEVVEQHTSVVMIMRCPKGNEMSCVKHRSSVIQHILHVYDRVCLEISPGPLEYLIHPHCLTTYPLPTISRIPMKQVAKSILNKECFIPLNEEVLSHVPGHHSLLLKELLFFEPYHYLGMELLKDIFNDQGDGYKSAVPESIIQKMSVCMAESWQNFAYTLQVFPAEVLSDCECRDNVRKCRKTLSLWAQASGSGTLESLRIDLSYYSIFARRDPLVSGYTLNYVYNILYQTQSFNHFKIFSVFSALRRNSTLNLFQQMAWFLLRITLLLIAQMRELLPQLISQLLLLLNLILRILVGHACFQIITDSDFPVSICITIIVVHYTNLFAT